MTPIAALRFLLDAGCDVPVLDRPRNWLDVPAAAPAPDAPALTRPVAVAASPHPALACDTVAALQALLGQFPDAKLRPPLLYEGALDSGVWVLIDRPDQAHRETINRMMTAIDLDWSRAALVSRLAFPTPGDGEPTPSLLARFTPVLERLFQLAPPHHVLALGQVAAEMAGPQARLTSSHGCWFDWGPARLLPTAHPRTMAGNTALRKAVFGHLKTFRAALP